MSKNLVFSYGFGELYFELGKMFCESLYKNGNVPHNTDVIFFTNNDNKIDFAESINVNQFQKDLWSGKKYEHHKYIPSEINKKYSPYETDLDMFLIKTLPSNILRVDNYDFILYFDPDILILSDISSLFNHKKSIVIESTVNKVSVFHLLKYFNMEKYLKLEELKDSKEFDSSGGGVFGLPKRFYSFFDDFRFTYLKYINELPHDAAAIALTFFRNRDKYPLRYIHPNNNMWKHYWGESSEKKKMIKDFKKMFRKTK